jgi:hypothetical protein
VKDSPFRWYKVLPGKLNFNVSDIYELNVNSSYLSSINEFKRPRCYVGDYCDLEIILRDSFLNPVDQELSVLKHGEVNIIALGPYDNIDGVKVGQYYFNNLTQFFPDRPEKYHMSFGFLKVGRFKLYARYKTDEGQINYAKNYPVEIETYSDRPSHVYSIVSPTYKYVGATEIQVIAKDRFNNTLTDYGVKMRSYVEFDKYSLENDTASDESASSVPPPNQQYLLWDDYTLYEQVGHSIYLMKSYPVKRGYYNLTVFVCQIPENDCEPSRPGDMTKHALAPF